MIRLYSCLVLLSLLTGMVSNSATVPANQSKPASIQDVMNMSVPEVQQLAGRKFTLREKVQLKIMQVRYRLAKNFEEGIPTPKQHKQARLSSSFGSAAVLILLLSLTGFALPGAIILLSLPLGIAALILGIKSVRGNGNTTGIIGIITGGVVTFFWLLALILIALVLSSL